MAQLIAEQILGQAEVREHHRQSGKGTHYSHDGQRSGVLLDDSAERHEREPEPRQDEFGCDQPKFHGLHPPRRVANVTTDGFITLNSSDGYTPRTRMSAINGTPTTSSRPVMST